MTPVLKYTYWQWRKMRGQDKIQEVMIIIHVKDIGDYVIDVIQT